MAYISPPDGTKLDHPMSSRSIYGRNIYYSYALSVQQKSESQSEVIAKNR